MKDIVSTDSGESLENRGPSRAGRAAAAGISSAPPPPMKICRRAAAAADKIIGAPPTDSSFSVVFGILSGLQLPFTYFLISNLRA